jgi:hypothetical protein
MRCEPKGVVSIFVFSVQPPCSLCLCGEQSLIKIHYGVTENTEDAQRRSQLRHDQLTAVCDVNVFIFFSACTILRNERLKHLRKTAQNFGMPLVKGINGDVE